MKSPVTSPASGPKAPAWVTYEQVIAIHNDVADVYADAEHDAAVLWRLPLISGDRLLYGDGTGDGIDG